MAVVVTVNGRQYAIPETRDSNWGPSLTAWMEQVSSSTLQKTGGTFALTNAVDFGGQHGLLAEDGVFRNSLTISGVAVNTDALTEIPTTIVIVSGTFDDSLTVSGTPVTISGLQEIPDPIVLASGVFSDSLTVSGVPVTTSPGVLNHSELLELDYISSGHTGFTSEAEMLTVSGYLQDQIDNVPIPAVTGTIGNKLGLTHSPVGLWEFEFNYNDTSGNNNTLTELGGDVDFVAVSGMTAVISNNGGYLRDGNTPPELLITGDVTLQVILQPPATPLAFGEVQPIIIMGNGTAGGDGGNVVYGIEVQNDTEVYRFKSSNGNQNHSWAVMGSMGQEEDIELVTMVRESDIITYYRNGTKFGAPKAMSTPTGGTGARFLIFTDRESGIPIFHGHLFCVKIIDRALTPAEVFAEYETTWV